MQIPGRSAIALALVCLAFVACRSASPAGTAPALHEHTFVFLRAADAGAAVPRERMQELMKGHLENIGRLAQEGRLLVAGPFGKPNPEPALRGLFVLTSPDVRAAEALLASDPAIAAGVLAFEAVPWTTSTDLLAVNARDLEFEARRATDPSIGAEQGMRSYVVLFADDGTRAEHGLVPMRDAGKVVLSGAFGGSRRGQSFHVLDATDAAAGEALLGPVASALGPHRSIQWWGSAFLR